MSLQSVEIKKEYRSFIDNIVKDFYTPLLKESTIYKRAVGFFSSSALIELTLGISGLIENGGRIELIASPKLSVEDIVAIEDGLERQDSIIESCLLREIVNVEGKFAEERLNLLSNLIASGRMEIKIAITEKNNQIGMYHEKMGLLYDADNNIVAFTGSMNESANAFSHNYETIDVFTSWSADEERVLTKQSAFNALWNDYEPHIHVRRFPEVEKQIIQRYSHGKTSTNSENVAQTPDIGPDDAPVKPDGIYPRVPDSVNIREYQDEAIRNWADNNYRGIFDMATGTGKTYTALAAISNLYQYSEERLAVIIVCPYQHLVEQWKDDIELFGMKPIVCYSASSQKNWRERVKNSVIGFNLGVLRHFCIVTTNATFATKYLQSQIDLLQGNTLLVVDEAHNFGAAKLRKLLLENMRYRLALSATIERYSDVEGTDALFGYFGKKCIEYTLKEAIENDMLTPYYYYPIVVALSDNELDEYLDLTKQITSAIMKSPKKDGKRKLSTAAQMLLIRRARLVAAAINKLSKLEEVIADHINEKHILIYCGATTLRDLDYKEGEPNLEDIRQIDAVSSLLGNKLGIRFSQFTSRENAQERESIKVEFAAGKHLQALVAIRCLDEGVNIPSIESAYILASSTNPKEYVQRRGRVLRKYEGKQFARIFDFITLPIPFDKVHQYSDEVLNDVKSLAKREITRMLDFAAISENPSAVDTLKNDIIEAYRISIEGGQDDGDW
ncbi:MAG: DEAD/DEAH box helicase family protein [Helicobacteraceae bacterium]|jgi:superfamily II DNA or RNA helicase|nr:DEAD/DEAH box helicase family protein [Helicobacteraceae bacterium]